MNQNNRVFLSDMKARLQERMHYENPDAAFDALLYGWAKKFHHGTQWLSMVKKRNWVFVTFAEQFEAYCGYKIT